MEYYLFASNDCNLGCKYCSVLKEHLHQIPIVPNFTNSEFLRFVQFVQKRENDKSIDIIFFGGEPTLNYPYIYGIIDTFKNLKGYGIRFFLHTNGLLLDKINPAYLQHLYQIIISINYEMIDKENLNNHYFSKIIKNIQTIREISNVKLLGRLTITEKVSLYTNVLQICDFFDSIYWQLEITNIKSNVNNLVPFEPNNNIFSFAGYDVFFANDFRNYSKDYLENCLKEENERELRNKKLAKQQSKEKIKGKFKNIFVCVGGIALLFGVVNLKGFSKATLSRKM